MVSLLPLTSAVGLAATAVALAGGLAAAAGLVVLGRRLAGATVSASPPAIAWAVAAVGLAAVAAIDLAVRRTGSRWPAAGVRCGVAAAALAVLPPSGWTASPGWLTVSGCLAAIAATLIPPPRPQGSRRRDQGHREHARPAAAVRPPAASQAAAWPGPPVAGLRQRLERYDSVDGLDCLRGLVLVTVEPGGRAGHAHVGFCPAFAATPVAEVATSYDGVEVTVTVAEVLPWGVRLECRLADAADEPLSIPVDVHVRASA